MHNHWAYIRPLCKLMQRCAPFLASHLSCILAVEIKAVCVGRSLRAQRHCSSLFPPISQASPRFVNMKFKVPKFKVPTLITTREDSGQKEFVGLTGKEWVVSTGVLCGLYLVLAAFFTVLLVISQTIRNNGDYVRFVLSTSEFIS